MLMGGHFKDNRIFYLLIYLEITQLQPSSPITEMYIVTILILNRGLVNKNKI